MSLQHQLARSRHSRRRSPGAFVTPHIRVNFSVGAETCTIYASLSHRRDVPFITVPEFVESTRDFDDCCNNSLFRSRFARCFVSSLPNMPSKTS